MIDAASSKDDRTIKKCLPPLKGWLRWMEEPSPRLTRSLGSMETALL